MNATTYTVEINGKTARVTTTGNAGRAIQMAAQALKARGKRWVDVTCDGKYVWAGEVSL